MNYQINRLIFLLILITVSFLTACTKEEEANFTADFNFEMIDANHVLFSNASSGEYYSVTWDFANGETVTTSDKKETFQIYYPNKGDYNVSISVLDYSGNTKTKSKVVSITNTILADIVPDFSIQPNANPNYLVLSNTTDGEYDSFKWIYLDQEVVDETPHTAYFPLAGIYDIKLVITRNDETFVKTETITILEDDQGGDPNLYWSEEFNYTGLPSSTNWNMETGGGGWGNNELQYYTNREANAKVENGFLTITALEESYSNRNYTSARITTQNKFDFQYGRIEARIKLPYGQGLWPAFWMLGSNISSVGWPSCGEIDIMEMIGGTGNDNTTHSTLHWSNNGEHASYGQSYSLPSGILADDFHVFAVEWDETRIKGFIDDNQYFVADITPSQLSEFHDDFFIILNVAVGGNWPGAPNAATVFPQTMQVDYVRVYKEY